MDRQDDRQEGCGRDRPLRFKTQMFLADDGQIAKSPICVREQMRADQHEAALRFFTPPATLGPFVQSMKAVFESHLRTALLCSAQKHLSGGPFLWGPFLK